ncbi:MAG: esterase-like activity of phytase family protein, partial [Myxococcota bacterium]
TFVLPTLSVSCKARVPEPPPQTTRAVMESHDFAGFSGLALDGKGRLWAVPERITSLVRLETHQGELRVAEELPIDGYPEGLDLESLAIAGDTFYVGTESLKSERAEDPIIAIQRTDGGRARVTGQLKFVYSHWNTTGSRNHGIEGVCVAGDKLVAAAEVGIGTSKRKAPVGVFDLKSGAFEHAWWVPLTSETGKLSALDCNVNGGVIDVRAIERHYGVGRLVSARLDPKRPDVETRVVVDLERRLDPLPNLEGIAMDAAGTVHMITDNQGRTASGPTLLFTGVMGQGLFKIDGDRAK